MTTQPTDPSDDLAWYERAGLHTYTHAVGESDFVHCLFNPGDDRWYTADPPDPDGMVGGEWSEVCQLEHPVSSPHDHPADVDCNPRCGRWTVVEERVAPKPEVDGPSPLEIMDAAQPGSGGGPDFDPYAIAEEARRRGEDPLSSVLGQYGGHLSSCWENLAGAGTFESTRAVAAFKAVEEWVRGELLAEALAVPVTMVPAGSRVILLFDEGAILSAEDADRLRAELQRAGERPISAIAGVQRVLVVDERGTVELGDQA
jgi:hypothetical protein